MKKIIFTALILLSVKIFSQATYSDQAGKWRLGLNAGAMWQTADVTPHANIAGGFTIERILNQKADALLGFSLGFRYLSGHCTGLDTKASYGVANNTALNGTYDSTTNYAKHGGIFYNNYKTYIHEGALELKMNFPRFEQKTHLIFHVMGGLGICNYKTWINALDVNGQMYDFTTLHNAQNVTAADVKKVLTGSYGTLAQGSSINGTTTWLPSVGVGFGFKLSKHAALVFEYRVAFPRTNLLDGVTYDMNNEPIKNNDFYHYASANLVFTIYGKQTKSSYNPTPAYTNASPNTNPQPINNNTYYNNNYSNPPHPYYNNNYSNNNPYYGNQPQVYPPYVNIVSPSNNYSSPGNYISVQGVIQNIQSANQVSISQNGYPIRYFSYDPYNGNFSFQTFLQQGTNNIIVTANSQYGTGSQGVTVFYNPPYTPNYSGGNYGGINNYPNNDNPNTGTQNNTPPHFGSAVMPVQLNGKPFVQFTNPLNSPEEVVNPTYNVSATVQNITMANQITVSINGNNIPQFNFNPTTKTVNFMADLLTGYNSIHISAANAAGIDAKSTVIDFKPTGKPPRIDLFNPASSPYTTLQPSMIVNGYVYNVSSSSEIAVNYNGNILNFNYNSNTHEIDIPVNLLNGSNQLSITASNTFGNDVKQLSLVYVTGFTVNPHNTVVNNGNQTLPTFTATSNNPVNNQGLPNFNANPHNNINNQTLPTFTATSNNPVNNQGLPNFNANPHNNISNQTLPTFTATSNNPVNNQGLPNFNANPHNNINNQTLPTFTATQITPDIGNQTQSNGNAVINSNAAVHHQPEITLTSPSTTPYTTMSGVISVSAYLNYVYTGSGASVTYEGNQVSCSFNPNASELLNFTSPLKPGMNTFVIHANNSYGTVTKSIDINYVPTNTNGNVNGNPTLHFSNGINNNANTPRGFNPQPIQPAPNQINQQHQINQQPSPSNPGRPFRPRN
ncbi:MAG TPA: hypothetical protein VK835_07620 [Bacteroidia bacterium]|nr:hypothetical protein [Bacteroidia bacterium]